MAKWLGVIVTVIGLLLGVVALRPSQWVENISEWRPILLGTAAVAIVAFGAYLVFRRPSVRIVARRKDWWERKIESVIKGSTRLIVVDSYQGTKHSFWTALERRLECPEPFEFTLLRLKSDAPFLAWCLDVSGASSTVVEGDREGIRRLRHINDKLRAERQKILNFGFWSGISPGPIVYWEQGASTCIAFGLWVQVHGSTDLTPWIVVTRGPLFDALKKHCDAILSSYERDA